MEGTALSVPAGTNRNSVFRPYREGAARFLPTFIRTGLIVVLAEAVC